MVCLSFVNNFNFGEHSAAYLTSRSYSIQYVIIIQSYYTLLLFCSLKDNYKKITLPSIVVRMVQWIRNNAFNQESGVRVPTGALFHKIKLKFKIPEYETECYDRKKSECDLDVRYAKERAPLTLCSVIF